MPFIARQEFFTCEHCQAAVEPLQNGSYRNHCPFCLWSKHVDKDGPGDRESDCRQLMKPIGLDHKSGKGWLVQHECVGCGKMIPNRLAPDDNLDALPKEH